MDWWLILIIFIILVLIVWWLLSRQTVPETAEKSHGGGADHDDLTKIEGIGPKVQGLFNEAGIHTFAQLAANTPEELDAILDAAGSIYKAMDETTWPKQAK